MRACEQKRSSRYFSDCITVWKEETYKTDEVDGFLESLEARVEERSGPLHVSSARRAGKRDGRQTESSNGNVESVDEEVTDP